MTSFQLPILQQQQQQQSFNELSFIALREKYNINHQSTFFMKQNDIDATQFKTTTPVMSWQSSDDFSKRREIIKQLFIIMKEKNSESLNDEEYGQKLPIMVRRIELALYVRAASLKEYLNLRTLQRRVQYLIITLHHFCKQKPMAMKQQNNKREFEQDEIITDSFVIFNEQYHHLKKLRHIYSPISKEVTFSFPESFSSSSSSSYPIASNHSNPPSSLLFNLSEDIIRYVFSFLSGKQTASLTCLNQRAYSILPSAVNELNLSLPILQHLIDFKYGSHLTKFCHLKSLKIFHLQAIEGNSMVHEFDSRSAPRLPYNLDNNGEKIIKDLAALLQAKSHIKLENLSLQACFVNTCSINAIEAICRALRGGACPELKKLSLAGNCLGDRGAIDIAELIASKACLKLKHLDLRRNFIGEIGFNTLFLVFRNIKNCSLENLCLGNNISGDNAITNLAIGIKENHLRKLSFLGLEDNYISTDGVHQLAKAISLETCPELKEICIGDNAIDNSAIHDIFCQVMNEAQS